MIVNHATLRVDSNGLIVDHTYVRAADLWPICCYVYLRLPIRKASEIVWLGVQYKTGPEICSSYSLHPP